VENFTIIIWFWIPVIDVLERYIDFLYVNMNIWFTYWNLNTYSVAMLLNIVPPQWLHRRGSNSQHINFKLHRLKNMSLGNRYRSTIVNKSHSCSCLYWKFVFLALLETPTIHKSCLPAYWRWWKQWKWRPL